MTEATPPVQVPPVAQIGRALFEHVVAFYAARTGDEATDPVAGAQPLPSPRRYLAGGAPREVAWDAVDGDDGQFTLALERIILGQPDGPPVPQQAGARERGRYMTRSAVYELQVVRRAPTAGYGQIAPGTEALDEHGEWLLTDAAMLTAAMTSATIGTVLTSIGLPEHAARRVLIGDVVAIGPQGYLSAISQTITVGL